jgi:putative superfamily III holin-X
MARPAHPNRENGVTTIPNRGVTDILVELTREFTTLLRREIRLAKTEVSDNITLAVVALGMIAASGVLSIAALVILLQAAVGVLIDDAGFTPPQAALLIGVVGWVIAAIVFLFGVSRLKASNLAPKRTIEQLQRDAAVAKYQVTSR